MTSVDEESNTTFIKGDDANDQMMLKEMKFGDMMITTGYDGLVYVVHRTRNYSHNPD